MTPSALPSGPDDAFTPEKAVRLPDAELAENRDAAHEAITEASTPVPDAAEKLDVAEEEMKRRGTLPES